MCQKGLLHINRVSVHLVGVGVERHVGADDGVGELLLDHAHGTRHDARGVVGLLAVVRLEVVRHLRGHRERGQR